MIKKFHWAGHLEAPEEGVVASAREPVQPGDQLPVEDLLRGADVRDRLPLDAHDQVGNLLREVELVERHDHGDPPFLRQLPQDAEQLELVAHVEEGGRLVEHDDPGLLADRPREQDPLPLTVADLGEILLPQRPDVHQLHGLAHQAAVLLRKDAQHARVGVPPRRGALPAGHQLGAGLFGEHDRHQAGEVAAGHAADRAAFEEDGPADFFMS